MPASFVFTFCQRAVRLLLIVIAAGVSVSVETRKPIYRIRRYCKATSEYSPIRSIGLTLTISLLPLCVLHEGRGQVHSYNEGIRKCRDVGQPASQE